MADRKIFNFTSEISRESTFLKFGYYPEELGKSSAKFVVATCRYCGLEMEIRKGFFNKSGSACHKECRFKEMSESGSPFLSSDVREKARNTNLKKWGNEIAQKNDLIRSKIRDAKLDPEFQQNFKNNLMEKYGVDNICKIENHMEKVKETSLKKYGVAHFNMSEEVQNKRKETNIVKYGVENPAQNDLVKDKIKSSWRNIVESNPEKYPVISMVNNSNRLWEMIEQGFSLSCIAKELDVNRLSLNKALLSSDVRDKYRQLYSYPKTQKQREIYDYIKSMGFDDVVFNDNSIIGLELDIYVPSVKIAIEFNGSYWHSEAIVPKESARNKHFNKMKICERNGIRLIQIFEKQWEDKQRQILSFIRSACGKNINRIGARECSISHDPQHTFMDEFHIQGKPIGVEFWVNLLHNGIIVGSMSISSHHRKGSNGDEAVLSRMVFRDNFTIAGGASRMLSLAVDWCRQNGYKKLITWSDSLITNGKSYEKMGFSIDKVYGPDYFYWDVKNNCYRSKQSQKKSATKCPDGMTERDWCWERGLYRIWDCGKKRWLISL